MSMLAVSMVAVGLAVGNAADIGNGLWRTYGHTKALPLTMAEALKAKWVKVADCNSKLGTLFAQDKTGPSEDHPLALYYTSAGQIAGAQATVWGSTKEIGNAAPQNLIDQGYWRPDSKNSSWTVSVSFRDPEYMCSGSTDPLVMGDRLVINQDTIAVSIPLTGKAASADLWDSGSCMSGMGQHYFKDLKTAPNTSWKEDQLVPVVAMYTPDDAATINAFFFTTPVKQSGSNDLIWASHDWEAPALNEHNMCLNWCDDACNWTTSKWSTMHIFLNSAYETLSCPNGSGITGRSCDL